MLADWHLGEVVERAEVNGVNEYNLKIAEERANRAIEGMIRLARKHTENTRSYAGAVLPLVGDFVSGGLHAELKATDEEEAIGASIIARDWLRDAIKRVAGEFGRVYVPAVAGNHGRNTAKPEFKRYYKKNFDWLIIRLLETDFQDDPRVRIDWRPSNDVHFPPLQRSLHAGARRHARRQRRRRHHWRARAYHPRRSQEVRTVFGARLAFDKLVIGHWHQRLWLPRAIVGNTIKGFDEYAKNQLGAKPDRPTQPLWFVHPAHGQTAHWDVYVDDMAVEAVLNAFDFIETKTDPNWPADEFAPFSNGEVDLIVTKSPHFARRHRAATHVCKRLNLPNKQDRIAVYQAVLYGMEYAE
jgi:hypothetical protein